MMHGQASNPLTSSIPGWLLEQVRAVPSIVEDLGEDQALLTIDFLREQIHRLALSRQLTSSQTVQLLVRLASYEARIMRLGGTFGLDWLAKKREALPN